MLLEDYFTSKLPINRPVADAESALTQYTLDFIASQQSSVGNMATRQW